VNLVNFNLNQALKHVIIVIPGNFEVYKIVLLFVNCVWPENLRVAAVRLRAMNVCRENFKRNKALKHVMIAVPGNFVVHQIILVHSVKNAISEHSRVKGVRLRVLTASQVHTKINKELSIVLNVKLENIEVHWINLVLFVKFAKQENPTVKGVKLHVWNVHGVNFKTSKEL
jgi:hypothetical protein